MATNLLLRGRHFQSGVLIDVTLAAGRIASIQPAGTGPADLSADFLAPAFFDLQINGGHGIGFTSPRLTADGVRSVVELCRAHGIAGLCPTVVTNAHDVLRHAFAVLRQACESDAELAEAMPRFHLEGPFISPEDGPRGAHPRAHVRPCDEEEFQRLQEAAGGRIGLVTLAPEAPGALPFIERRAKEGVVVSLGHSGAAPETIRAAVRAGARLSTHLGNGCPRTLPRHENLLWEQLAADELSASLITDGCHLPWSLVRCFIRMKRPERIILTCDVSEMGGLPPGRYGQWDQQVEVMPEGKIILCGQGVLAGSWAFTDHCVARLTASGHASPAEALMMAGENPRRLLGLPVPRLEPGQPGDLLLLSQEPGGGLTLTSSVIAGRRRPGPTAAAAG